MPAKAVVLAAGRGARLSPITPFIPKEMLPVKGFPAIHHVLFEVLSAGVKDVLIVLSEGKDVIRRYLTEPIHPKGWEALAFSAERERLLAALHIEFALQKPLLGTAHAIGLASGFAGDDPLLVVYPDDFLVIPQNSPEKNPSFLLLEANRQTGSSAVLTTEVAGSEAHKYGVIQLERRDGRPYVAAIREKPQNYKESTAQVMIGRMVLTPRVVRSIPSYPLTDEEGIIPLLSEEAENGNLRAVLHRGARYDIGSHQGYLSLCSQTGL